jgi:hypothetical protein
MTGDCRDFISPACAMGKINIRKLFPQVPARMEKFSERDKSRIRQDCRERAHLKKPVYKWGACGGEFDSAVWQCPICGGHSSENDAICINCGYSPKDNEKIGHAKSTATDILSRKQAATNAGLSKRQKDTAIRVSNIPDEEFQEAVESGFLGGLSIGPFCKIAQLRDMRESRSDAH